MVNDLLKDQEDWLEQMRDYKNSLDKLQYSDTEQKLQQYYDDLMLATKGHLSIYKDETEKDQQKLVTNVQIPVLPSSLFDQEMKKVMESNYSHTVYSTGKKVVERLIAYYVKPTKDSSA